MISDLPRLPDHRSETPSRGRSLGKLAIGLRAVRSTTRGPISVRSTPSCASLIGFVEIYLAHRRPGLLRRPAEPASGKRLGDHAAGTYVVRERVRPRSSPAPDPAAAARWQPWARCRRHRRPADRARAGDPSVPRPPAERSTRCSRHSHRRDGSPKQARLRRRAGAAARHPSRRNVPRGASSPPAATATCARLDREAVAAPCSTAAR